MEPIPHVESKGLCVVAIVSHPDGQGGFALRVLKHNQGFRELVEAKGGHPPESYCYVTGIAVDSVFFGTEKVPERVLRFPSYTDAEKAIGGSKKLSKGVN